jgi:hypothetical protein
MPELRAHLQTMASYNAWANQRVYPLFLMSPTAWSRSVRVRATTGLISTSIAAREHFEDSPL